MEMFTVRELRERTGDLIGGAERGRLSLVTKHGRPVFVAVPIDEELVRNGVMHALAVKLFEERICTLAQAAKVAGVPLEAFARDASRLGIPIVDYAADELADELDALRR